jgi:hypothetical protein
MEPKRDIGRNTLIAIAMVCFTVILCTLFHMRVYTG